MTSKNWIELISNEKDKKYAREACFEIAKEQREKCLRSWLNVDPLKYNSREELRQAEISAIKNGP